MPKGFVYYKRALDVDALTHGTSAVRSLRQKGQPWAGALACLLVLLACIPVSAQQNASTQAPAAGEQTDTSSQSLANPAPTEQASPADQAREAANPLANIGCCKHSRTTGRRASRWEERECQQHYNGRRRGPWPSIHGAANGFPQHEPDDHPTHRFLQPAAWLVFDVKPNHDGRLGRQICGSLDRTGGRWRRSSFQDRSAACQLACAVLG